MNIDILGNELPQPKTNYNLDYGNPDEELYSDEDDRADYEYENWRDSHGIEEKQTAAIMHNKKTI